MVVFFFPDFIFTYFQILSYILYLPSLPSLPSPTPQRKQALTLRSYTFLHRQELDISYALLPRSSLEYPSVPVQVLCFENIETLLFFLGFLSAPHASLAALLLVSTIGGSFKHAGRRSCFLLCQVFTQLFRSFRPINLCKPITHTHVCS